MKAATSYFIHYHYEKQMNSRSASNLEPFKCGLMNHVCNLESHTKIEKNRELNSKEEEEEEEEENRELNSNEKEEGDDDDNDNDDDDDDDKDDDDDDDGNCRTQ
ncbi:hypothetical protein U1Q18_031422 [Sarracenia purpurea var. burkii]